MFNQPIAATPSQVARAPCMRYVSIKGQRSATCCARRPSLAKDMFKDLQAVLDTVLRGTVYAGQLAPVGDDLLLQTLKPEGYKYLTRRRITEGDFSLSLENLAGFLNKDECSAVKKDLENSKYVREEDPIKEEIELFVTTDMELNSSAKVGAEQVPLRVEGKVSAGRKLCATIKLTEGRVRRLSTPTAFLDHHFKKASNLMIKHHKTNRSGHWTSYIKFYVVTAVYEYKWDIKVGSAWTAGVEGDVVMPALATAMLRLGAGTAIETETRSRKRELIALRVCKVKFDNKDNLWQVRELSGDVSGADSYSISVDEEPLKNLDEDKDEKYEDKKNEGKVVN